MAHHPALRMGFDVLKITLGACCVAAGVVLFLAPNQVVPGGFVGASFLLDHVLNVPLSLSYLIFNAVLIGLGVQVLGRGEFLAKTLWGIMALTIALEAFGQVRTPPTSEPLLLAVYGGLMEGVGLALVFHGGGTTGGIDIVARLVKEKRGTQYGTTILTCNVFIFTLAGVVFGAEKGMIALLVSFVSARTIDAVLQGANVSRTFMIVSAHSEDVRERIAHGLNLGVTRLHASGGYSGQEQPVLMVMVPRTDELRLQRMVLDVDPRAFITVLPSHGVTGGYSLPQSKR